ncbi:hypothetical protein FisN_21Lu181 [Fistulifera solaris]|uniref:Spondin domain-containing protein n=1 Tax=Fistulifera solaris TaxID=1519565 RepID=A0A1Z5J8Z1_FISSO|nr:hypothetical protein FisN_21Lu181 [Fistulifera solaris]|eukprot:GAX10457.1 hypothetical protein FisN_21Lu181 [Fistulifera solaris]
MDIIAVYDKTNAIKDVKKGVDMPLKQVNTFRLNGLKVDKSRPFVTAVTRLSPSPDWLTGFDAFSTQQDGFWYSDLVIETWALDAGTSTGFTYTDKPTPESPAPQSIQLISNGIFDPLPVARWRCELTTPQPVAATTYVPSLSPALSPEATFDRVTTAPYLAQDLPATATSEPMTIIPSVIPTMESTSEADSSVPSIAPTVVTEVISNTQTPASSLAPVPIAYSIPGTPTVKPTDMPSKAPSLSINPKSPTNFPSNDFPDDSSTPVTGGIGAGAGIDADSATGATHDKLGSLALAVLALLLFV